MQGDLGGYTVMYNFDFTVTVHAATMEQAQQVMRERIDHTEDYGFLYLIDWS